MPVLRAARKRETALEPLSGGVPTRPGGGKPRRPRSLALVARAKTNDMESWKITQVPEKTVGEGGIRTLGSSRINGFQDRRLRPLSHLSGRCASITDPEAHPRNRAGSGCCGEAGAETFHPCGHPPLPSPRVPVSVTAGYAPPPHRPLLLPGGVDPLILPCLSNPPWRARVRCGLPAAGAGSCHAASGTHAGGAGGRGSEANRD